MKFYLAYGLLCPSEQWVDIWACYAYAKSMWCGAGLQLPQGHYNSTEWEKKIVPYFNTLLFLSSKWNKTPHNGGELHAVSI